MELLLIIAEMAADIILLLAVFSVLATVGGTSSRAGKGVMIAAVAAFCLVGAVTYATIASQSFIVKLVMTALNLLKYLVAAAVVYRRCDLKLICIVLIVQFVCNMLTSAVNLCLATEFTEQHRWVDMVVLLAVRSVVLLIMTAIRRRTQNVYTNNALDLVPKHIFLLILACCFFASGLIHSADIDTSQLASKLTLIKFFSMAVMLCISAVAISLLTNVLGKRYYSDISRILEQQVQTQLAHYEQRERANTEIRSFRHDYNNHISCIRALLDSGRYDEVEEYLGKLSERLPSGSFNYSTGNYLSDAILSDKQESAGKDGVEIAFSGTIPTSINNTDLCIILTNALDNAIEACRAYNGERRISVFGGFRHGYFILIVKNPTVNSMTGSALPATTKQDKQHHGFGLLNISAVVEKYDGFIKHEISDGQFVLSLTFNSVTEAACNTGA